MSDVDVGADTTALTALTCLFVFLILAGSLAGILVPAGINWDFGNFYDAGRRIVAGEADNLYAPHSLIGGRSPQATTGFWGTPLTAYLYVPFAFFDPTWGLILFKVQTAIFSIAALALLYSYNRRFVGERSARNWRFAALFAFISLIYQPIWTAFRTGGQTTPVVFFLLVLSLLALTTARPFQSSLAFSFAVMIKPVLITALLFFVVLAGIKYLKYVFYVFCGTGLASLIILGWHVHAQFLLLMWRGLNDSVPWFYNSGLYVTFENLKLFAPPASWPKTYEPLLNVLKLALKLGVVTLFAVIVYRSRARTWTPAARSHFNFLLAISFFSLFGHIVYEAYLTFLFIVLTYIVASERHFGPRARFLIGTILFLSFWQNIIWADLLRHFFRLDSVPELIAIGLFKSGPLILLLVFLWRHHEELFESYDAEPWTFESRQVMKAQGA